MRTIKFRGKRIDNREWVYGFLVKDPQEKYRIYYQPFEEATSNTYHFVDPETVGQYIGKIKTEQEIYINDLVQHGETVRIVEYRNGNTCLIRQNKQDSILLSFSENPKKVGNIFDNPELLTP
jgi:hypothetical protein